MRITFGDLRNGSPAPGESFLKVSAGVDLDPGDVPQKFRQFLRWQQRAAELGDTGASAPDRWVFDPETAHLAVLIYARDTARLADAAMRRGARGWSSAPGTASARSRSRPTLCSRNRYMLSNGRTIEHARSTSPMLLSHGQDAIWEAAAASALRGAGTLDELLTAILLKTIEHMQSEDFLLFSTDYPHAHFDGEDCLPDGLPDALIRKILVDNPLAAYPRLARENAV